MSRYVHIELRATSLEAVEAALSGLGLPYVRPRRRVRLEGSLECTGDPVDIRLEAGVCDTVEDFGFVVADGALQPSAILVSDTVSLIEINGAPIELMQVDRDIGR